VTAGEFDRIDRLARHLAGRSPDVPVGVGDDAAVVRVGGADVVLCVDAVVEGVHFTRALSDPADVGWKVVAVNVSDAAAMGARPRAAVIALHRPADLGEDDVDALYEGMAEAAARWGVQLVGGDTVRAGEWAVGLTLVAELDGPPVTRGGARPGDVVVLAGALGASAAALVAHAAGVPPDPAHLAAHRRPTALPATGLALAAVGATAMIDVSDGLGSDARHLAAAGGVVLDLDPAAVAAAVAPGVPRALGEGWLDLARGGGEDFALLATLPADGVAAAIAAVGDAGEVALHAIGRVAAAADGRRAGEVWLGTDRRIDHLGYDHG
jgi:thiamine-monophosphate kinase